MQALEINLVAYVGAADEYQLSLADYGILAGRAIGARKPVSICGRPSLFRDFHRQ